MSDPVGSDRRGLRAGRDAAAWAGLESDIVVCERCPRLRRYARDVATRKRRMYRDQTYWGRPVPGFGDRRARILVVGLAPAAHGANRTGRMFTGDRSGEWLYGALHRAGLASRPDSTSRDDGMRLHDVFITAPCRCAPPANRPTREELDRCSGHLDREIALLRDVRVAIALGAIAWNELLRRARRVAPGLVPRPAPKFGHGAECRLPIATSGDLVTVVGSYHVSQQNTQTGRLTRSMLDRVIRRATRIAARD